MFVTTRILVVDLLSGRLSPSDIAGIYVLNAHRVSDSSGEGFVVRLFRTGGSTGNTTGFVRGFSDAPSSFTSEFGKTEKVMKALYAKRLHLWPRFQVAVQEDLEARPPELVEVSLPCDPGAALVYEALAELVDSCIKELRKLERLDTTDLTPSQGLSSSFDETIRRQLAPIWHTVSPKTRQIVADLRTLRTLAGLLNKLDPITFLNYLDTLRVTEGTHCAWLFHSAAHTVFEAAKARVYSLSSSAAQGIGGTTNDGNAKKRKAASGASGSGGSAAAPIKGAVPALEPVLDELPKWHALLEILDEARQERNDAMKKAAEEAEATAEAAKTVPIADQTAPTDRTTAPLPPTAAPPPPPILVFCQDEYTCTQLREVAGPDGPSGFMRRVYREYLQYKIDSGVNTGRKKGNNSGGGGSGNGNGGMPIVVPRLMGGYLPGEEEALAKEAKGMGAVKVKPQPGAGGGGGGRGGRGGGRGGRGMSSRAVLAAATSALAGNRATVSIDEGDEDTVEVEATEKKKDNKNKKAAPSTATAPAADSSSAADVIFVALDSTGPLPLWQYSPTHVVVYDPDVALTRSLELFKAQRRSVPLRVYLLRYEDSPEMDKYQAAVVRERSSFESLIRGKGIMAPVMLPTATGNELANAAGGSGGGASGSLVPGLQAGAAGNALTRRAGGRLGGRPERIKVIVDVREFMSPLPAVLHAKGLEVVPLTLEVGDYVLSPEVCVERKSLTDLRGSLISGRLYQQAEAMCRHYRTAVLLIEFEGDRAFAFQGVGELGDDIQSNAMMSRLVLLCLHHPRLRIVWSRSLHATADIFKQMKANHEEPDPITAATVGVAGDDSGAGVESVVNSTAIDLLKRLPGVNDANYRALMREAGSLAGLATMSLERLTEIMGGEVAARKLREFLAQECRSLFRAL
jgi:DNA excision repair protein ERCC-4